MKTKVALPIFIVAGGAALGFLGFRAWKMWSQSTAPDARLNNADFENEDHPMRLSGRDMVDEASWESFPASDAPARY